MTNKELREKSKDELQHLLAEERNTLRTLRFRVAAGEHANVRDIRKHRTTVARLLTLLTSNP